MSGALPDACPRCQAFLVMGRGNCLICGYDPSSTPAPPASAPPEVSPPPGAASAPIAAAAPRSRRSFRGLAVLVVLAVAAIGGGTVYSGLDDKDDEPSLAGWGLGEEPSEQSIALAEVCTEGRTLPEAKPYRPGPGRHHVEVVTVPKAGDEGAPPARWWSLGDADGWDSPEHAYELDLAGVELVACFHTTKTTRQGSCDGESIVDGSSGSSPLYDAAGRVDLVVAATGKVVQRTEVGATEADCPFHWRAGDRVTTFPLEAIRLVITAKANDGTEPAWTPAAQAAGLCRDDLRRITTASGKPEGNVAVLVSEDRPASASDSPSTVKDTQRYEAISGTSPLQLPPGFVAVPAAEAGTVVCLRTTPCEEDPQSTLDLGPRRTVAAVVRSAAAGTTARGDRDLLECTPPRGQVTLDRAWLDEQLAAPRA